MLRKVVFPAGVWLLAVAEEAHLTDTCGVTAASVARSMLDGTRIDADLENLSEPERVACWRFAILSEPVIQRMSRPCLRFATT